MGNEAWLERVRWVWPCIDCGSDQNRPQVELIVLAQEAHATIAEAHCAGAGHKMYCIHCRGIEKSATYRIADAPPHIKQKEDDRRPKQFVPDDLTRQRIYERDRTCRFCNFDVIGMIASAVTDAQSVPALASLDKVIQRVIAERVREYYDTPSLFDLPGFATMMSLKML